MPRKKKEQVVKPRLVKTSRIECLNGYAIIIGQRRRDNESEPIMWEYEIVNRLNLVVAKGENQDKHKCFHEAVWKSVEFK